jgi:hypothetical protein
VIPFTWLETANSLGVRLPSALCVLKCGLVKIRL